MIDPGTIKPASFRAEPVGERPLGTISESPQG
jgi:hypothetical protein